MYIMFLAVLSISLSVQEVIGSKQAEVQQLRVVSCIPSRIASLYSPCSHSHLLQVMIRSLDLDTRSNYDAGLLVSLSSVTPSRSLNLIACLQLNLSDLSVCRLSCRYRFNYIRPSTIGCMAFIFGTSSPWHAAEMSRHVQVVAAAES
jgi:hypothetical protein